MNKFEKVEASDADIDDLLYALDYTSAEADIHSIIADMESREPSEEYKKVKRWYEDLLKANKKN